MLALTLLSSLFAAAAVAAPTVQDLSARAGGYPNMPGDNGSCAKMGQLCSNQLQSGGAPNDPFGVSRECAINAMCTTYYSGTYTVDVWINIHFASPHTDAMSAPRLSKNVFTALVASGASKVTEQSFIDAYFSSLNSTGGPWPDVSYVKNVWASIAHWTGICATKSVPYNKLADWFQYSSTNAVPGSCNATTTSVSSSTSSTTTTSATTTTSTVLPRAGTTTTTTTPTSTPSTAADNGSCAKVTTLCQQDLFTQGNTVANENLLGISKACTLAATCYTGTVDAFLSSVYGTVYHENLPYLSAKSPRFPQSLYNTLVAGGSSIATQQSYIDAYYSLLATVGGPYPDVSFVNANWARIAAWTGFCSTKNIPYQNLADWVQCRIAFPDHALTFYLQFQYSSTVSVPGTC